MPDPDWTPELEAEARRWLGGHARNNTRDYWSSATLGLFPVRDLAGWLLAELDRRAAEIAELKECLRDAWHAQAQEYSPDDDGWYSSGCLSHVCEAMAGLIEMGAWEEDPKRPQSGRVMFARPRRQKETP